MAIIKIMRQHNFHLQIGGLTRHSLGSELGSPELLGLPHCELCAYLAVLGRHCVDQAGLELRTHTHSQTHTLYFEFFHTGFLCVARTGAPVIQSVA